LREGLVRTFSTLRRYHVPVDEGRYYRPVEGKTRALKDQRKSEAHQEYGTPEDVPGESRRVMHFEVLYYRL